MCGAEFYFKRYLTDHVTRVHGVKRKNAENKEKNVEKQEKSVVNEKKDQRQCTVQCQEENCQANLRTVSDLRKHLVKVHEVRDFGSHQNLEFENYTVFLEWLAQEEQNSNSKFVINSKKRMKDFSYVSLLCSRSGTYKPKVEDRDKQLKSQGSSKLGFNCTAGLQVKEYGDHVSVTYFKNHYKHSLGVDSLSHLPIPMAVKENIGGAVRESANFQHASEKEIEEHIKSFLKYAPFSVKYANNKNMM